jgi:TonB family protein
MASLLPVDFRSVDSSMVELPPHARLPRLDLGIDWESRGSMFRSSVAGVFTGPPAPKDWELKRIRTPRVDWVEGKIPGRSFLSAVLLQVAIIWLLISPIWGWVPEVKPTLAPLEVDMVVYDPPDLPKITLPANTPKKKAEEAPKQPVEQTAENFHPRQTIISIPVRVTHPRQTLIRPEAPAAPPKIVTPLPNIVEWSGAKLQRPHLELAPTASTPKMKQRALADAKAPELNAEKNPGPIDIAPSQITIAKPKLALDAMSSATAKRRETHADAGAAAPEVGSAAESGGNSLRSLIALSAAPAPPAPDVKIPDGNLAARISISPEGGKGGGSSTGAKTGAAAAGAGGAGSGSPSGSEGASGGSGASNLPAAISVSSPTPRPGNGGLGGNRPLNLKIATPLAPSSDAHRGPTDVSHLDPGMPPEKILSGKEVYTLHANLPNLTSETGSWILDFAELDEMYSPRAHEDKTVSCPQPIATVDPKYPPELIKAHVRGQIVLYAIVRKDGAVDSIQVVRGLDPQLDRNAIDALAHWKFRPGTHSGVPTDFEGVFYVPFSYVNPRE